MGHRRDFGLTYFDTITLIGQGIHTMGIATTDWDHIYQESASTPGFLTWDTSGPCVPQCGSNLSGMWSWPTPATGVAVGITNTALTSNVATVTTANRFTVGETVVVAGTTNGSGVFNGKVITTAVSSTSFNFALTHANVTRAADTGTANSVFHQHRKRWIDSTRASGFRERGRGNQAALVGGTTPLSSCTSDQNGPTTANTLPECAPVTLETFAGHFVSAADTASTWRRI